LPILLLCLTLSGRNARPTVNRTPRNDARGGNFFSLFTSHFSHKKLTSVTASPLETLPKQKVLNVPFDERVACFQLEQRPAKVRKQGEGCRNQRSLFTPHPIFQALVPRTEKSPLPQGARVEDCRRSSFFSHLTSHFSLKKVNDGSKPFPLSSFLFPKNSTSHISLKNPLIQKILHHRFQLSATKAFTLAEVLIVLGVIGVIAALTIPAVIENTQKQELVSGVIKFYSVMSQAVLSWKADIGCGDDAYSCLAGQGLPDNICSNFDQIGKFLSIIDSTGTATGLSSVSWLPDTSYLYSGTQVTGNGWGGLSNDTRGCKYLLKDGMTLKLDPDITGFVIRFDINGKKPPNRVGKDIYILFIGEQAGNDVHADLLNNFQDAGLCGWNGANGACVPGTIDPTINNGATPTSYVLLNKKIPDYYK